MDPLGRRSDPPPRPGRRPVDDEVLARRLDMEALDAAVQRAVRKALLVHKKLGNPVATWKDGKVVWIPPEEIEVEDD